MADPTTSGSERFWRLQATALCAKLNFHHWMARVIPLFFGWLVLAVFLDLFCRETNRLGQWLEAFLLTGFGLTSAVAWILARKHFCTPQHALGRLETVLNLHNGLSAASEGIVAWPERPQKIDDGFSVNWSFLLLPVVMGSLFLWAADHVPINRAGLRTATGSISEPPAFAQVQSWIDALKQTDLIEPEKLQSMQDTLNRLKEQPASDWYSQNNLEAADALKELTEQSMNSLAQNLDHADGAVEALRKKQEGSHDPNGLRPLQDAMRREGEKLVSGDLPLKHEVVGPMLGSGSYPEKSLTSAQLQALHEQLKKGKLAAQTSAKSQGGLSDEMQRALADAKEGGGLDRRKTGAGGARGGKKSAPLELQARDRTSPVGDLTAVNNEDRSRAALGQTVKVSAGVPDVDPSAYGGRQGAGAAQVQGNGGEAVWRSTYEPQEADALTQFFK